MAIPYYRKNLYVLWVGTFLAAASWTQVVPFLPRFLAELGVRDGLAFWSGLAVSAHFVPGTVMMPYWGRLADRYGRKPMVVRAGLCLSAIYFLMSFSTQPWHVAVCRLLNGALTGFIPMAVALVGTNTPPQYSARFVASVQTSAAAGTIIGPVLGGTLAGLFGVRGALYSSSILVLLSTLLVIFLVEERRRPAVTQTTNLIGDIAVALSSPIMGVVMLVSMLGQAAQMGVQPVLVLHVGTLLGQEAAPWVTGLIMALPGFAFVLSATRWVRLLDRHPLHRVTMVACVGGGITHILSGVTGRIGLFVPAFFTASVFVAAFRPMGAALVATEVEEDFRGRAFGLQTAATTVGGLLGPLPAGLVADAFGRRAVFVAIGVLLLVSPLALRGLLAHVRGGVSHPPGERASHL